jgi:hypothetical protein
LTPEEAIGGELHLEMCESCRKRRYEHILSAEDDAFDVAVSEVKEMAGKEDETWMALCSECMKTLDRDSNRYVQL